MAFLLVRYNLKEGVSPEAFESWVRDTDQPTMRSLKRVERFETYRATGLLMGEGAPSQSYFEIFEIDDLAGFISENLPGDTVQSIMSDFVEFVIAEKL
jgi:hypothetical protein